MEYIKREYADTMMPLMPADISDTLTMLMRVLSTGKTLQEVRALMFDTVPQRLAELSFISSLNSADNFMFSDATFRLACQKDITTICDFRCTQSFEYWSVAETTNDYRSFRRETEMFLRRKLNTGIFFAFIERDGEIVSMSGLELADRIPVVTASGAAQHSATLVACYTPPLHRGKGYMRYMLSVWNFIALMLGVDTVYIETRNDSMHRIAQSMGFEHVSDKYRLVLPVDMLSCVEEKLCSV